MEIETSSREENQPDKPAQAENVDWQEMMRFMRERFGQMEDNSKKMEVNSKEIKEKMEDNSKRMEERIDENNKNMEAIKEELSKKMEDTNKKIEDLSLIHI